MHIPKPPSQQPIPKHAQKVFEGVLFEVYQWEQKMFDGSTATFEKLKRPDTVIVFPVLDDGSILLTKQKQPGKQPFIGAVGGRVDKGETVLDTAQRELREESGYEAGNFKLWKSVQPISKIEWAVYVFVGHDLKKVTNPSPDTGEKIELMPVNFDSFLKIALQPNFYEQEIYREVAEALLDNNKKNQLRDLLSNKKHA